MTHDPECQINHALDGRCDCSQNFSYIVTLADDWRKRVKDVEPTRICPTCGKTAPFGQLFFVGVEGFVQGCRSCRSVDTTIYTDSTLPNSQEQK